MNDRASEPVTWSKRQWSLLIAGFFLAQVALIFTFSEYRRDSAPTRPPHPNIHLLTESVTSRQLANTFFALDPTLFSSASLHSFSGPAWLRVPPVQYTFPDRDSPLRWLTVDQSQLGTISDSSMARLYLPLQPGMLAGPKIEQNSFVRPEFTARTQSVARLTGDLAARAVELPKNLRCWPPPADLTLPLVGNSIVEIAVDNSGEVIASHVRVRSGLDPADAEALRVARTLHFAPLASSASPIPLAHWGNLIVEWQTALSAETNAVAGGMQ